MTLPLRAFCCYAREDQRYLYELKKHLMALQREGLMEELEADGNISPGKEWRREISRHLDEADLIFLLISADFIASDYCYQEELARALARHDQGTARVVPVIIRSSVWQRTAFGKLQAVPDNGKPVENWQNRDEAYTNITERVRAMIASSEYAWKPHIIKLLPASLVKINFETDGTLHITPSPSEDFPGPITFAQEVETLLEQEKPERTRPLIVVSDKHLKYLWSQVSQTARKVIKGMFALLGLWGIVIILIAIIHAVHGQSSPWWNWVSGVIICYAGFAIFSSLQDADDQKERMTSSPDQKATTSHSQGASQNASAVETKEPALFPILLITFLFLANLIYVAFNIILATQGYSPDIWIWVVSLIALLVELTLIPVVASRWVKSSSKTPDETTRLA